MMEVVLHGPEPRGSSAGGTRLRHTIDGEATGDYEAVWRERIEPVHHLVLEAMLDNVGRIVEAERAGSAGPDEGLPAGT